MRICHAIMCLFEGTNRVLQKSLPFPLDSTSRVHKTPESGQNSRLVAFESLDGLDSLRAVGPERDCRLDYFASILAVIPYAHVY
jgi:hypothetical protein